MSMNLTDKQYLLLSQFSYINFNDYKTVLDSWRDKNYTLSQIVADINQNNYDFFQNGSLGNDDFYGVGNEESSGEDHTVAADSILGQIANDPVLSNLTFKEYINNNAPGGNGLVAYCFENNLGDTVFTFTGTEGGLVPPSTDWLDNIVGMYFNDYSSQVNDAKTFVENNRAEGEVYVTGHSKGGANALYVAASLDDIHGKVFDAPGVNSLLSITEKYQLSNADIINYVAQDDIVGNLMYHSEKQINVEQVSSFYATIGENYGNWLNIAAFGDLFSGHYTQTLKFSGDSLIATSERTYRSITSAAIANVYLAEIDVGQQDFDELPSFLIDTAQTICDIVVKVFDNPNIINGTDNVDNLLGTTSEDIISGYNGNDFISGNDSSDHITGGSGDDLISGDNGDDYLFGEVGNDIINGGVGNDQISGGAGDDDIFCGDGDDFSSGEDGADLILGEAGDDLLSGMAGADNISGGAGNDRILGGQGGDTIHGDDGNDLIRGGTENDYLYGDNGIDVLYGEDGDDRLYGNSGSDIIYGGEGSDTIEGNDDDDCIFGDNGNDIIYGGLGNDIIQGGSGNDILIGNEGQNQIWGGDGDDTIWDGADNSSLYGGSGVDIIRGYDGNDILNGEGGNDTLYGGNGDDYLFGSGDVDTLYGEAGNDQLDGGEGNDILYGDDGNDELKGMLGDDNLNGGNGDDYLYGGIGNDTLNGGTGTNMLYGGSGNDTYNCANWSNVLSNDIITDCDNTLGNIDTLQLATQDGTLFSQSGNDLTISYKGNGNTVVVKNYYDGNDSKIENISFQYNNNVTIYNEIVILDNNSNSYVGNDINEIIVGKDGTDVINGSLGSDLIYGGNGDDHLSDNIGINFLFGDDGDDIIETTGSVEKNYLYGGNGNDLVTGGNSSDDLYGGEGNDQLFGGDGDDYLDPGNGNDFVYGGNGNDNIDGSAWNGNSFLYGGDGDDNLFGGNGEQNLFGENGDDLMFAGTGNQHLYGGTGYDNMFASDGDQFLDGGDDDDEIHADGSTGNSTLIGGAGNDKIWAGNGSQTIDGGIGNDTLWAGSGLQNLIGGEGNDIIYGDGSYQQIIDGGDGDDQIYAYGDYGIVSGQSGNDNINLYNHSDGDGGTGTDTITNYGSGSVNGGDDNDIIISYGSGTASGGNGNDNISAYSSGAPIVVNGDAGDDIIASYGNDFNINGGKGSDTITVSGDNGIVNGGDGNDTIRENWANPNTNTLNGGAGDDSIYSYKGSNIDGGSGNDMLYGSVGSDVYKFGIGSGCDIIIDSDSNTGNIDAIKFGEGILPSDIIINRVNDDMRVDISGYTDSITINNYYQDYGYNSLNAIEQFRFNDDTVWNISDINSKTVYIHGTDNNENLKGTSGNDIIFGAAGDDVILADNGLNIVYGDDGNDVISGGLDHDDIYGGNGNDYINGYKGNDYLEGGAGNDTYSFCLGYGTDTVLDQDSTSGNIDIIEFGQNINPLDISIHRVTNDMEITIAGSTDKLIIKSYYENDSNKIEKFVFNDGTIWDTNMISTQPVYITGTDNMDIISGDSINSYNEIFNGKGGDDTLQGYMGNDTYIFGIGYGTDTIKDEDTTAGNIDTIKFGNGISASDIRINRVADNMEITINGQTDKLIIQSFFSYEDNKFKIEKFEFSDGTTWGADTIRMQPIYRTGTDSAETISGNDSNAYNEIFDSKGGDDILNGSTGNDNYIFGTGYGSDSIYDHDTTTGNVDKITYADSALNLIFSRNADDLVISNAETSDVLTVKSWYSGSSEQVEQIYDQSGSMILNTQVEQLIQEMAAFEQQNNISWSDAVDQRPTDVQSILSQFWVAS